MAQRGAIARRFEELRRRQEAALIPFVVAGDPDLATTARLVSEMAAAGADLIELGIPFSDPMADGPANQRASARGLAGGGSLPAVLAMVSELRERERIPIILFGYFNPFFRYGCDRLCADAARAGVDGLLVVDMPPEESAELRRPAQAAGIDLIYLLAPTTPLERSRRIAHSASGFLYYVSVTGVTGTRSQVGADVEANVRALRDVTELPIGVGFGVSSPEQAAEIAVYADAVVVGSAFSLLIESDGRSDGLLPAIAGQVRRMKAAMREARSRRMTLVN